MKKKVLVLIMGCALALAGCGGEAATEQPVAEQTEAEAGTENNADATAIEGAQEDLDGGYIDEEFTMGEEVTPDADGRISNGFMSIKMPAELDGTYIAYAMDGEINIYDKESADAGFGGFAFGVSVTEDYGMYGGMRTKIGELKDQDGRIYHVLISYPSDVQWDYTKGEEAPASYQALYDAGREIAKTLEPVQGGEYVDGGGTKGEDIYGDYVKELVTKIQNAKDSNELEAEDLSPVYYAMTQGANPQDPMKDIGVAYVDFNLDGVDEMIMGDIKTGEVYDIYASVDGKPAHVISGHWRDYFKIFGPTIAEYVPEAAGVNVINTYDLTPNSIEMFPQYSIKTDETEGAESKWAVSYDGGDNWEPLSEEDYNIRLNNIENFPSTTEIKYTALGSL
jgi:hypothetical protein